MRLWISTVFSVTFLFGCGDTTATNNVEICTMSNEDINDTQWVMWEAMPQGKTRENPMARMKFFQEDGKQKVRYTVKSLGDSYIYECQPKMDERKPDQGMKEWYCSEESHIRDWCQALEVHTQDSCNPEKLKEMGAVATPKELEDAVKLAKETVAKYRDKPTWAQFKLNNNNLSNKLQGLMYVKVKKARPKAKDKRCKVTVTDQYMTIYDGKRVVDSNPVGTNAFVQTKTDYEYEHCLDPRNLLDYSAATLPEDLQTIPPKRLYEPGQTVYYHYMGEKDIKAEDGCTYSRDISAQWLPKTTGEEVAVSPEGVVQWNTSYVWNDVEAMKVINDQSPAGILKMVRYKTCADGKKEQIDVLCRAALMVLPPDGEEG